MTNRDYTLPEDWIADTLETDHGSTHARLRCPDCDTEPYIHPFGMGRDETIRAECPDCGDSTWVEKAYFR